MDDSTDADEQGVGREQDRAEPGDGDESDDAQEGRLRKATINTRAGKDRRQRQNRQEQDACGLEQGERSEARDRGRGVRPGLTEES